MTLSWASVFSFAGWRNFIPVSNEGGVESVIGNIWRCPPRSCPFARWFFLEFPLSQPPEDDVFRPCLECRANMTVLHVYFWRFLVKIPPPRPPDGVRRPFVPVSIKACTKLAIFGVNFHRLYVFSSSLMLSQHRPPDNGGGDSYYIYDHFLSKLAGDRKNIPLSIPAIYVGWSIFFV